MGLKYPIMIGAGIALAAGLFFIKSNPAPTETPASTPQLTIQQQQGLALVTSYCADCHAVGFTGESQYAPAPRFRELHERYDVTFLEEALVEGLVAHPDMPEFEFDTNQAVAIIEYLGVLQER